MTDLATASPTPTPTPTPTRDAVLRLVEPPVGRDELVGADVVVVADRPIDEVAAVVRTALEGTAFTLGSVLHHGPRRVRCRLARADDHLHVRWRAVIEVQAHIARHLEIVAVERLARPG